MVPSGLLKFSGLAAITLAPVVLDSYLADAGIGSSASPTTIGPDYPVPTPGRRFVNLITNVPNIAAVIALGGATAEVHVQLLRNGAVVMETIYTAADAGDPIKEDIDNILYAPEDIYNVRVQTSGFDNVGIDAEVSATIGIGPP